MSFYRFLASDNELDGYDNTGIEYLTFEEAVTKGYHTNELWNDLADDSSVMVFEDENKINNLRVVNQKSGILEFQYTKKENVAVLEVGFDECRSAEIINYIKTQIEKAQEIELWVLLLDQDSKVIRKTITIEMLNHDVLKEYFVYDFGEYPRCLTITNK